MYPERMQKISIAGTKKVLDKVIEEIHSLEAIHLINHVKREESDLDIGEPLARAEAISEVLIAIRSISSTLTITGEMPLDNGFSAVGVKNMTELSKTVFDLQKEVSQLVSDKKKIEERIALLHARSHELQLLAPLRVPLDALSGYSTLEVKILDVTDAETRKKLTAAGAEIHTAIETSWILAFIPHDNQDDVSKVISEESIQEVTLPGIDQLTGDIIANLRKCDADTVKFQKELERKEFELRVMTTKWKDFLILSQKFLEQESDKASAPLRFATSKHAFVFSGWIPEKSLEEVKSRLDAVAEGEVFVETHKAERSDSIPIKLHNTKLVQPFEFVLRMYSLPKYTEIDPSSWIFIGFPIFFGMILGDIGYGVIGALLFILARMKLPQLKAIIDIMLISSISSIIFGVIFGEVFGSEVLFGYHLPYLFHRSVETVNEYMLLSIAVGFVHVNIGLILGLINVWRQHGVIHAITEKFSWFIVQLGVAMMALAMLGISSYQPPMWQGGVVLTVGILLLVKGEGVSGIIELPAIFSNMLSYSRIMAVGLSSVMIAVQVNKFADIMWAQGGAMIIAAIAVLLVGHTINIVLGMFGGFLHSLRLHYVEFFTKFYKGGGEPYSPFGLKG